MDTYNENILKSIQRYQERLHRYRNEEDMLHVLEGLKKLPVNTAHLEDTGLCRTLWKIVNASKKHEEKVREAAAKLVATWKDILMKEDSMAHEKVGGNGKHQFGIGSEKKKVRKRQHSTAPAEDGYECEPVHKKVKKDENYMDKIKTKASQLRRENGTKIYDKGDLAGTKFNNLKKWHSSQPQKETNCSREEIYRTVHERTSKQEVDRKQQIHDKSKARESIYEGADRKPVLSTKSNNFSDGFGISRSKSSPPKSEQMQQKAVENLSREMPTIDLVDQLTEFKVQPKLVMTEDVYSREESFENHESSQICVSSPPNDIDAFGYTGGVQYNTLKSMLVTATPDQLGSDELWSFFCKKEFSNKEREELESWRDFYMRCLKEREARLLEITASIKRSQDESFPVRSEPPTSSISSDEQPTSTTGNMSALAESGVETKNSVSNHKKKAAKPKKAPLMAKTLAFIRRRYKHSPR